MLFIVVVRAYDGTGQRRVLPAIARKAGTFAEPAERDAAWSPDGRRLALVRPGTGGKAAIHLVDVASGEARALTDGTARDDQPVFSPDGRKLVFSSNRDGATPYQTSIFIADFVE